MSASEEAAWLTDRAGVRVLQDRVLVRVGGEDARRWLNGQVTNDLSVLVPGGAIYALVLQVKGRVIADVHVLDRGAQGLAFVAPRRNLDGVLEHLEKYIIMEDVVLEPERGLSIVTVQGPRAAEVAGAMPWPSFPCDRLGTGGRDVLVEAGECERAFSMLVEQARALGGGPVGEEGWQLARIRLGRPEIFADFGESTLPQEAGLGELALSFTKGCYLGQEVVCMLEHRGRLTRRLARLSSTLPLEVGEAILHGSEGRVGEITSAIRDPERGGAVALGFVKRRLLEAGAELRTERAPLRILGLAGAPPSR